MPSNMGFYYLLKDVKLVDDPLVNMATFCQRTDLLLTIKYEKTSTDLSITELVMVLRRMRGGLYPKVRVQTSDLNSNYGIIMMFFYFPVVGNSNFLTV